jgi:hypothetical protein
MPNFGAINLAPLGGAFKDGDYCMEQWLPAVMDVAAALAQYMPGSSGGAQAKGANRAPQAPLEQMAKFAGPHWLLFCVSYPKKFSIE